VEKVQTVLSSPPQTSFLIVCKRLGEDHAKWKNMKLLHGRTAKEAPNVGAGSEVGFEFSQAAL